MQLNLEREFWRQPHVVCEAWWCQILELSISNRLDQLLSCHYEVSFCYISSNSMWKNSTGTIRQSINQNSWILSANRHDLFEWWVGSLYWWILLLPGSVDVSLCIRFGYQCGVSFSIFFSGFVWLSRILPISLPVMWNVINFRFRPKFSFSWLWLRGVITPALIPSSVEL